MEDDKEKIQRDRPAEKGRNNDPDLRDETDTPPGTSTISDSPGDRANEHITKTASDDFRTTRFNKNADATFDDIDNDKV